MWNIDFPSSYVGTKFIQKAYVQNELFISHFTHQLHASICQSEDLEALGLQQGGQLVESLKQRVVVLASNSGVISSVQRAAQATLQSGWSILLPTPEERARALSSLLSSNGQWFIINPL